MGAIGAVELLLIIGGIVAFLALVPLLLQWLWNMTMPEVFELNQITFWQAFRLIIIAFLLFGIWSVG